ncbi:hypothetical protein VTN31DRAFT_6910 [Thermomyces dupontii]|uniref:uncharacterized protein n=1 Tax=Talaromyces thermophilus TaxID=28565 RepID=UPI003743830C
MGSSLETVKTLTFPALFSLAVYLLFGYVIIPFFKRYHQRYSQYLPLDRLSIHTSSLRERMADALMRLFLPSTWRRRANNPHDAVSIYEEEGENMVGMDLDPSRREALERRRSASDNQVRLSRDLEEGFMDDSEDEDADGREGQSSRGRAPRR